MVRAHTPSGPGRNWSTGNPWPTCRPRQTTNLTTRYEPIMCGSIFLCPVPPPPILSRTLTGPSPRSVPGVRGGTGGAEIEPHIKNEIIEIFQFVRKSCFSKFQFLCIFGLCLRILEPFRLKYRSFLFFFNKNISNVRLLTSQ